MIADKQLRTERYKAWTQEVQSNVSYAEAATSAKQRRAEDARKYGILFLSQYRNLCGCCACQLACKDHNNLAPGEFYRRVRQASFPARKRRGSTLRHVTTASGPCALPHVRNGAFYKEADGTVRHDDGKCIGCGKCLWACPYGSISLSKERGVAQKCTGCYDRRQQGLDPRAWLRASTGACNGARPTAGATRRHFTAGCPRFFLSPGRRAPDKDQLRDFAERGAGR